MANTIAMRVILTIFAAILTGPVVWALFTLAFIGLVEGGATQFNVRNISGLFMFVVVPIGGILGVVAAWIRITVPGHVISTSPRLCRFTILGLAMGVLAAGMVVRGVIGHTFGAEAVIQIGMLLLVLFLLAATIGQRPNAP